MTRLGTVHIQYILRTVLKDLVFTVLVITYSLCCQHKASRGEKTSCAWASHSSSLSQSAPLPVESI